MLVYVSASKKLFPVKQLKYCVTLSKIYNNLTEFIFRVLSKGKNSNFIQKINLFHVAQFEKALLELSKQ